jgi:ankyrin repeat protein
MFFSLNSGENEAACQIARKVTNKCDQFHLNQQDTYGRTVLHLAAIERLPKITKIFVENEQVDVLRLDQRKRTALHYATENGTCNLSNYSSSSTFQSKAIYLLKKCKS